jgi:sporulation protein YlmC with PRC-barrel domain
MVNKKWMLSLTLALVLATSMAWAQAAGQQGMQSGQQSQMKVEEDLVGKTVVSSKGEDLGRVEDVVADQNGKVQYIILSHGGMLGMGGERVPVPWSAVQQSSAQQAGQQKDQADRLVINIDKQKLENAPKLSRNETLDLNDPQMNQKIHSYYGTESQQKSQ